MESSNFAKFCMVLFSCKQQGRPLSFSLFLSPSSWCNYAVKRLILNFCNYPSISTLEARCCTQLQSSRKVLRTTVLVGKLPMSPVHSLPKGLFRIPGHQPSVLPSSKVYLSPDDHIAYKGVCVCVYTYLLDGNMLTWSTSDFFWCFLHACTDSVCLCFVENYSFYAIVAFVFEKTL